MTDRGFPYQYIVVEGNIGAGKTTFCKLLETEYNCKLILEQFSENPFLPYFYKDPERFAFSVELFFMTERHKQLQELLAQKSLFHDFTAADYHFVKTLLFAQINLTQEEFRLFQRLFNILKATFPKPDLIVYLHKPVSELLANIRERGRDYEQDIDAQYLTRIQNAYFDYFKIDSSVPTLIINTENIDFLNNPKHYQTIVEHMKRPYNPGLHQISFVF